MLPGSRNAALPCASEVSAVPARLKRKKATAATERRHTANRFLACTQISNAVISAFVIANLLRIKLREGWRELNQSSHRPVRRHCHGSPYGVAPAVER